MVTHHQTNTAVHKTMTFSRRHASQNMDLMQQEHSERTIFTQIFKSHSEVSIMYSNAMTVVAACSCTFTLFKLDQLCVWYQWKHSTDTHWHGVTASWWEFYWQHQWCLSFLPHYLPSLLEIYLLLFQIPAYLESNANIGHYLYKKTTIFILKNNIFSFRSGTKMKGIKKKWEVGVCILSCWFSTVSILTIEHACLKRKSNPLQKNTTLILQYNMQKLAPCYQQCFLSKNFPRNVTISLSMLICQQLDCYRLTFVNADYSSGQT